MKKLLDMERKTAREKSARKKQVYMAEQQSDGVK
jgi:hypothetical protein